VNNHTNFSFSAGGRRFEVSIENPQRITPSGYVVEVNGLAATSDEIPYDATGFGSVVSVALHAKD
jgi:hypothetical protein